MIAYSVLGGMWSITLTDLMQFVFMTVGIFAILLPFSLAAGGGWSGIRERLDSSFFDLGAMGLQGIITQFVIYGFGMLIGQDIWQRVFTARSPGVARWGGVISAGYVALYGVAGALIGTAAAAVLPTLEMPDEAFATMAQQHVPVGLGGVVLAAGVAAMMSTASGATIAAATVARVDVVPTLRGLFGASDADVARSRSEDASVLKDRVYVVVVGLLITVMSMLVSSTVVALTIAYDLLVGGLLVAILGGLLWPRATAAGAMWSMGVGVVATVAGMMVFGVLANAPIYMGLIASAVVFVAVSLMSRPTPSDVSQEWNRRIQESKA